jgi:hypothetical protein
MRTAAAIGLLFLLSGAVFGQAQPAETLPTFDLADVHPSTRALTLQVRVLG